MPGLYSPAVSSRSGRSLKKIGCRRAAYRSILHYHVNSPYEKFTLSFLLALESTVRDGYTSLETPSGELQGRRWGIGLGPISGPVSYSGLVAINQKVVSNERDRKRSVTWVDDLDVLPVVRSESFVALCSSTRYCLQEAGLSATF